MSRTCYVSFACTVVVSPFGRFPFSICVTGVHEKNEIQKVLRSSLHLYFLKMPISAWFMDDDTAADQRLPRKQEPNKPVSRDELAALGVLSWEGLDADK